MLLPARLLIRATLVAAAAMLAGCASYDNFGNRTWTMWPWDEPRTGQAVDYTHPSLPVLPRSRPVEPLWERRYPDNFIDLSPYSLYQPGDGSDGVLAAITRADDLFLLMDPDAAPVDGIAANAGAKGWLGHNGGCAARCDFLAGAIAAVRAGPGHGAGGMLR